MATFYAIKHACPATVCRWSGQMAEERRLEASIPRLAPAINTSHVPNHSAPEPQAEREAEERRLQETIAELEAARKQEVVEEEQGVLASLLASIRAFFQQVQAWLQQLWASLTGGSGSGSAAGASA